jgi:Squalene-hopene cyclase C-terminal domain
MVSAVLRRRLIHIFTKHQSKPRGYMTPTINVTVLQEGRRLLKPLRSMLNYLELPPAAKAERRRDRAGLADDDPGMDRAVEEVIAWLARAQDRSRSRDGGVARHFSLVTGWSSSYPETTGYIIPTLLDYASITGRTDVRDRAKRMLNWLLSIQLPQGGYQGGLVDATPIVPVTFNTGQILIGLASGAREWGEPYRQAMRRAADWLVATQDDDGCWRKHPTPFAEKGEKTYETHVAWGLLEAAKLSPNTSYGDRAMANIQWALGFQRPNGWLASCCLTDPTQPLTHTLGYALRGILEAYRYSGEDRLLEAASRTADGLLSALQPDGFLPGRLRDDWSAAVSWACLTGTVQVAACWLMLYAESGDPRYLRAGIAANRYVRRALKIDGPEDMRGGIKGSFPVDGGYGTYQYLNWAAKFFVDAHLLERELCPREQKVVKHVVS